MGLKQQTSRGFAREAILGATLQIIAAEGIDAVTHRRVAEHAGVSPGSTTHHFAGRADLIRETFRFYIGHADRFLRQIEEEVRAGFTDPMERVLHFASEIVRREFTEGPGEQMIRAEHEMLLYASADEELAADVRAWDTRIGAQMAGDLEAAGFGRPVETARTIGDLIRGFELERLLNPELDVEDFRRRLEGILVRE